MTPRNRRVAPPAGAGPSSKPAEAKARGATPKLSASARAWVTTTQAVLGAGLVLGLSVTLAWGARHYVLTSPRFAVTDVTVQGTRVRSIEGVAAAAGVERGMNVFSLDLDRARAKVLTDAWIATASLSRRLPGTVVIQVTEREAAAIVALPETYLASRDGRIFKRFEVGDPDDLPIVTGLTGDGVAQDREGAERAVLRAIDLATEYQRTSLGARAPLEEVHVSNGNELTLVVGKDTVSLALGAPPYRRKLEEAQRIFTELDKRGAHATMVMLDDESRPDRAVVRTR